MVFFIHVAFPRLGVHGNNTDGNNTDGNNTDGNNTDGNNTDGNNTDGNNTDGNTPDDVETNSGNRRQSLDPFGVHTDRAHDVSARDIYAINEVLKFEFISPVRDVETLHSNINLVFAAQHILSSCSKYCPLFDTLLHCYKSATAAILENHGMVLECAPQPVCRRRSRPLPQAAILQNLDARIKQLLLEVGIRDSYPVTQPPPVGTTEPIRYDDAYDNMLGTRSIDDGTAAAYAYRDGAEATNELRFRHGWHNGLPFGQDHGHITTLDRYLVEARQARLLAGLSTRAMDVEIAIRAVRDTNSWGWVGMSLLESRMMARESQGCN